jgi:hypothetical protein
MKQESGDALWLAILQEAEQAARDEPMLASFLHMTVLRHSTLEDVLAFHLSSKLASPVMDARADGAVPRGAGLGPHHQCLGAGRHPRLFRARPGL